MRTVCRLAPLHREGSPNQSYGTSALRSGRAAVARCRVPFEGSPCGRSCRPAARAAAKPIRNGEPGCAPRLGLRSCSDPVRSVGAVGSDRCGVLGRRPRRAGAGLQARLFGLSKPEARHHGWPQCGRVPCAAAPAWPRGVGAGRSACPRGGSGRRRPRPLRCSTAEFRSLSI